MLNHVAAMLGVVAVVIAAGAKLVINELHKINDRITNPEVKALIVDCEESFFSEINAHKDALNGLAAKFGVSSKLAVEALTALVDAEQKNPFSAAPAAAPESKTPAKSVPAQAPAPQPAQTNQIITGIGELPAAPLPAL